MSSITALHYFLGFWASVYLIDTCLRSNSYTKQWYSELTSRIGVSFHFLQARLFTDRFNGFLDRIFRVSFMPWRTWFSAGALFSAFFMLISVFVLLLLVYNTLTKQPIEKQIIKPVMPGVNLPLSHLGFYMLTLLVCAILHEAGHAIAALQERVRIQGCGVFLLGVYPGAFVSLDRGDLQNLSPLCQLRIYCAGIWHNAIIVFISIAMFYSLPWVLMPAYFTGQGVGVTYLKEGSVVTGNRGLLLGDAITRINACPVQNQTDWYRCLEEAHVRPNGYCVSGTYLNIVGSNTVNRGYFGHRRSLSAIAGTQHGPTPSNSDSLTRSDLKSIQRDVHMLPDCCPSHLASTHLCFTYFAYSPKSSTAKVQQQYVCLPARTVTERAPCRLASDCGPSRLALSAVAIPLPYTSQMAIHDSTSNVDTNPLEGLTKYQLDGQTGNNKLMGQNPPVNDLISFSTQPIIESDKTNPYPYSKVAREAVLSAQMQKNHQVGFDPTHAFSTIAPRSNGGTGSGSSGMVCVLPSPIDQATRLVRLVHSRTMAPAILFLGPVDDLAASVGVSDYVPRWPTLIPTQLPAILGLLCTYLFSLSGALVLLNSVPCYALDGQWILQALIELLLQPLIPSRRQRRAVFLILIILGTLLVCSNLFLALMHLFVEVYGSTWVSLSTTPTSTPELHSGPAVPVDLVHISAVNDAKFHQSVLPTLEHPPIV